MLALFDKILESGDDGVSIYSLVHMVYGGPNPPDHRFDYNTVKVTMVRLKERLQQFGWTVESGVAKNSATERVYRLKPTGRVAEAKVQGAGRPAE